MKNQVIIGKLSGIVRMPSSRNGNPRYSFVVVGDNGNAEPMITGVDSALGYSVTNYDGKMVSVIARILRGKLTAEKIKNV